MTNRQKQNLLQYLGYYTGVPDGFWGTQSRQATESFQRDYQLSVDGDFGAATAARILEVIAAGEQRRMEAAPDWWDDIRYFTRREFACKCGQCGGFPAEPSEKLVRLADQVRGHFGTSAIVSSGVRCPSHNARVGGVAGSYHLMGRAMDFRVGGQSAAQVLAYVRTLPIHYAYAIDDSYVHMDVA